MKKDVGDCSSLANLAFPELLSLLRCVFFFVFLELLEGVIKVIVSTMTVGFKQKLQPSK